MMNSKIDVSTIINDIKKSGFMVNCNIPLGYTAGLPIITEKNSVLCLTIPYLKYKITGEVDKTLVYPIKYAVTVKLPSGSIVKYEDLEIHPSFRQVDFTKPIGYFRHDAIKKYTKAQYEKERSNLFDLYNKILERRINGMPVPMADVNKFKELFSVLVEPSVKLIYKALDKDFYEKYMD